MIYTMARDLDAMIRARKFPVRVVYGPERTVREGFGSEIVVDRDRQRGDAVSAVVGGKVAHVPMRAVRALGCRARVYARSSLSGARPGDHEHECDALVDAFLVALLDWGVQAKAGDIPVSEARYLTPEELEAEGEAWPGVVYQIRFRVSRAVRRLDYLGQGQPLHTITSVGVGGGFNVEVRENPGDTPEVVPIP